MSDHSSSANVPEVEESQDASSDLSEGYYAEYVEHRGRTRFSTPMQDFYHGRMLKLVRPELPASPSILEVGFGLGHFAQKVRAARIPYQAVDLSAPVCKLAKSLGFDVVHSSFPFKPTVFNFNVVWMSHVLEHARDWHEARAMAKGAYDILPADGVFVVICPDITSWRENFWMDWSHGYATSAPRLLQLMRDVGFEDVTVKLVTASITNRPLRALLDFLYLFIPVRLIDGVLTSIGLRPYCTSFMTLFGWRHLCVWSRRCSATLSVK
jgi:hypothetical protein